MWEKNPRDFSEYSSFRDRCPKTFGMPNTTGGQIGLGLLHLCTFGLAGLVTAAMPDVGPTPSDLARYIRERLSGTGCRACYQTSSSFDVILDWIRTDLAMADPVIALISWGPYTMHYVNVVAVSDEKVAYLDTDNEVKYYSIGDFEDLMDCSSYFPHGLALSTYNLIRFEKSA